MQQLGMAPDQKGRSEKMHSHLEFELGRARAAEIRGEVERDRLESRLTKAHRAEELGLPRRGMARGVAARAMAILTALFR